jgi:hypothetical protein
MKNLVRAIVIALTLTGAVASTYAASPSSSAKASAVKTSAFPVPICPPGDPDACGL